MLSEYSCTAGRFCVIQTSLNVLFDFLCVGILQEAPYVYCYASLVMPITRLIDPGIIFVNVMLVFSHWKLIVHGDRLFRLELFSGL